ncbi:MFS transporter [Salirhabdus sp. Marseille-P4669]|uniref:MFS transporter n=1 Tax=Salirhabdus sp. Marseille-P4669 TaxID=2042310 RepID=UPI000C7AB88B|nr:MFS transporter [Salirhabdus sp. Marseille-P4669]
MKFKELHPNIKWRFVVGFLTNLSYMMVGPFLVIFFTNKVGAGITGVLYLFIVLSAIIGSFCGGYLSDRFGRVKVLFTTELFAAIIFFVIALLNSPWYDEPYLSAVAFIFYTFCTGCFQPVTMALILDSSTPNTREGIFRINYWISNLAVAIGSLIGGFLFMDYHFLLFVIVTITGIISVVITAIFLKDVYKPKVIEKKIEETEKREFPLLSVVKSYRVVFRDKVFLLFLVGSVLVLSMETQLTNYIGIRLANEVNNTKILDVGSLEWTINGTELLGILRSENTILVVVGTFLVTYFIKRLKNETKFIGGACLYACSFVAISYLTTPWLLLVVMLLATIGELIYVPIKQSILGSLAPDESRSSYMAVHHSSMAVTEIMAGIFIMLGTVVAAPIMTLIFGCIAILGILCYVKLVKIKQAVFVVEEKAHTVD